MGHFEASGFAALGPSVPQRTEPANWLVWHFTHVDNLASIATAGRLRCPNRQEPVTNIALAHIKDRRKQIAVRPDAAYPPGKSVADHVPFYIAAKSPMLYAVSKGHADYPGGDRDIVFLGIAVGAIAASGATWCASDVNASIRTVRFTRDLTALGEHVDFDLLCQRSWNSTEQDNHRANRRAAEVLVLDEVPLDGLAFVAAKEERTLARARSALGAAGSALQYHVVPYLYYS